MQFARSIVLVEIGERQGSIAHSGLLQFARSIVVVEIGERQGSIAHSRLLYIRDFVSSVGRLFFPERSREGRRFLLNNRFWTLRGGGFSRTRYRPSQNLKYEIVLTCERDHVQMVETNRCIHLDAIDMRPIAAVQVFEEKAALPIVEMDACVSARYAL